MKIIYKWNWLALGVVLLSACTERVVSPKQIDAYPSIYPDYTEVTIPATIAPMNFTVVNGDFDKIDVVVKGTKGQELHVQGKKVSFDEDDWHRLVVTSPK